jgi:hypothetical protein
VALHLALLDGWPKCRLPLLPLFVLCCSMDDESPGLENSGGEEQLGSNAFGSDGSGTNVHSFEVGAEKDGQYSGSHCVVAGTAVCLLSHCQAVSELSAACKLRDYLDVLNFSSGQCLGHPPHAMHPPLLVACIVRHHVVVQHLDRLTCTCTAQI